MLTSIYIHIPFCIKRCNYCDFNTYADRSYLIDDYIIALCNEIRSISFDQNNYPLIHTIYFGGGTPSVLPVEKFRIVLDCVREKFDILEDPEISMELNPGTINLDYLKALKEININRLSIGMQSANPRELKLLGRIHTVKDVINAVSWARLTGFDNINLDLIFGLPGQKLSHWENSLNLAVQLNPEHFSLYSLILEPETLLKDLYDKGYMELIDDDLTAEMYEYANRILENHGYKNYEISNWARTDGDTSFESVHNKQYWNYEPYIGFGLGSHSYFGKRRFANCQNLEAYINQTKSQKLNRKKLTNATQDIVEIDRQKEIEEMMIMGLRLTEKGISDNRFYTRFGISVFNEFEKEIKTLIEQGLIEEFYESNERSIRLTKKGRLLGNHVFSMFLR